MRPEEKGRFCSSCSKTVMDFSMMTDREVIAYLSRAGQQVCGRFAPEQLGRDIAVVEVGRRKRQGWWHWLVAGLLVSAEAKAQTVTKGRQVEKVQMLDTVRVIAHGLWTNCGRHEFETTSVTAGMIVCAKIIKKTVANRVVDTLAAVGLAPKRELAVYPNPVRRGGVMSLQWQQTEAGSYAVHLFNASGALVEQRKMEVGGKEQVDLLSLPPALPAGMYFLRVSRPGAAKVITLKIIVI